MDEFMSVLTKSLDTDELNNKLIKEKLKEIVPEDVYNKWIAHFVIEEIDDEQITIGYYGKASLKKFEKKYKKRVWLEICSYIGCVKQLNICKRKKELIIDSEAETVPEKPEEKAGAEAEKKTEKKIGHKTEIAILKNPLQTIKVLIIIAVIVGLVSVGALFGCNYVSNRTFSENFYNVGNIKANAKIRIIQISDLHLCSYGEDNSRLIERVKKLKPDIILYTGDCIENDKASVNSTIKLCSELAEVAPSYYVYGNNEVDLVYGYPLTLEELDGRFGFDDDNRNPEEFLKQKDEFEKELEDVGVNVLKNEQDSILIGTTTVDIYGSLTSNPSAFWPYSGEGFSDFLFEDESHIKVFAIHEPFVFEELESDFWGDLMLCGHTHGGVARVPVLGPLYTREGGLFPERNDCYVSGRYNLASRHLIVSPGLENKNIFRINNKPELTIVDINRF